MSAAEQLPDDRPIPFVRAWHWHVRDHLESVDASGGAKNLWQFLSTKANRYGESWPAVATIANKFNVTAATARRWRAELVELGVLEVDYRAGKSRDGQYRPNLYRLIAFPSSTSTGPTSRQRRAAEARRRRGSDRATSRGLNRAQSARRARVRPRDVRVLRPRDVARRREQLRMEVNKEVATECGSCGRPRELVEGTPWCGPCSVAVTLRIQRLGEREP